MLMKMYKFPCPSSHTTCAIGRIVAASWPPLRLHHHAFWTRAKRTCGVSAAGKKGGAQHSRQRTRGKTSSRGSNPKRDDSTAKSHVKLKPGTTHPASSTSALTTPKAPTPLSPPIQPGDTVQLTCDKLALGGRGVCRLPPSNFVILCRDCLPGERVTARITDLYRNYAEADKVVSLWPPSQPAVPQCEHFHDCGGCTLQNLEYAAQLAAKQDQVAQLLQRVAKVADLDSLMKPIVPAQEIYHYRNKMVFHFAASSGSSQASGQAPCDPPLPGHPVQLSIPSSAAVLATQSSTPPAFVPHPATSSDTHQRHLSHNLSTSLLPHASGSSSTETCHLHVPDSICSSHTSWEQPLITLTTSPSSDSRNIEAEHPVTQELIPSPPLQEQPTHASTSSSVSQLSHSGAPGSLHPALPGVPSASHRENTDAASVAVNGMNPLVVGLLHPGSFSDVLPIHSCAVQHPVANMLLQFVAAKASELGLKAYDPNLKHGLLKQLVIRKGSRTVTEEDAYGKHNESDTFEHGHLESVDDIACAATVAHQLDSVAGGHFESGVHDMACAAIAADATKPAANEQSISGEEGGEKLRMGLQAGEESVGDENGTVHCGGAEGARSKIHSSAWTRGEHLESVASRGENHSSLHDMSVGCTSPVSGSFHQSSIHSVLRDSEPVHSSTAMKTPDRLDPAIKTPCIATAGSTTGSRRGSIRGSTSGSTSSSASGSTGSSTSGSTSSSHGGVAAAGRGWSDCSMVNDTMQEPIFLVNLVVSEEGRGQIQRLMPLAEAIMQAYPEVLGVYGSVGMRTGSGGGLEGVRLLRGRPTITERLCGLTFEISPESFFQVNTPQAEMLYQLARDAAELQPTDCLLDLYCGTGTIGLTLARHCHVVHGYDICAPAIEDAKRNASLNKITNAVFHVGDVDRIGKELARIAPDVVVVDPARAGLGTSVVEVLRKCGARRIIYISCNPATLARDLQRLCTPDAVRSYSGRHLTSASGRSTSTAKQHPLSSATSTSVTPHGGWYKLRSVQPCDMFPHTDHVECVAVLDKV